MGEISEMMMDGTLCAVCGTTMHGQPGGFPRYCCECQKEQSKAKPAKPLTVHKTFQCFFDMSCARKFSTQQALDQHCRDAHKPKAVNQ